MKPPSPLEQFECEAFVAWLELRPTLRFSHIANETFTRSWKIKARNKKMGVRPGVPDYLIVIPALTAFENRVRKEDRLVFIEMKRRDASPSQTSEEQTRWIQALAKVPGVTARVCRGFEEARDVIEAEMRRP